MILLIYKIFASTILAEEAEFSPRAFLIELHSRCIRDSISLMRGCIEGRATSADALRHRHAVARGRYDAAARIVRRVFIRRSIVDRAELRR
jgi:hypothetical protein